MGEKGVWQPLIRSIKMSLIQRMADAGIDETDEVVKLSTHTFDARFPTINQTKNCWQNYVDHKKCIKAKGEEFEPCAYFEKAFQALCPRRWIEKWDDQID